MNETITNILKQGKTRLVMEYNQIDGKFTAIIQIDKGINMYQWWEWLSGTANTPDQALDKLAEQIAIEEA